MSYEPHCIKTKNVACAQVLTESDQMCWLGMHCRQSWDRGYKIFFMLNSAENEI